MTFVLSRGQARQNQEHLSDECHSPSAMSEEENAHDEATAGLLAKIVME
ncbi:MAG: hypothetical protein H7A40_00625 [Chlamydiales bacterium]|nr:hypothetical protein [Chlamydiales bacterium]